MGYAHSFIEEQKRQFYLFEDSEDKIVHEFVKTIENEHLITVGT